MGYVYFGCVSLLLIVSGIDPHDRFTWWLEVSWVILGLLLIAYLWFKDLRLSALLKLAIFLHALILIYGGAYTYELVPLGEWMKDAFGFNRNHYDRIGHFAQGFFPAILIREILLRGKVVNGRKWLEVIIFAFCMAFTAFFEILEFGSALAFGAASDAFLGSQGDIWDAQWDMLLCGIGALISILFFSRYHTGQIVGLREE